MEKGEPCSFHPNSLNSSITRTEEDYQVILKSLDNTETGWAIDVGHINADMDLLEKIKEYAYVTVDGDADQNVCRCCCPHLQL